VGRSQAQEQLPCRFFPTWFPNLAFPGKPSRAPSRSPRRRAPASPTRRATHAGGQAVGRGGLVDVVGVGLGVGAARRRLPLAPARRAAVHHAGLCPPRALRAAEGVALLRHHPGHRDDGVTRGRTTRLRPQAQTPLSIPPALAALGPLPRSPGDRMGTGVLSRGSLWVTRAWNPRTPPQHPLPRRSRPHSPSPAQVPPGAVQPAPAAAPLVAGVAGQEVLG